MKKLMIAAAIVCAAAFTQAATADWTITNVKDPANTANKLTSGSAYLFCFATAEEANAAIATIKAATTLAAFKTEMGKANYSYNKISGTAAGAFSVNEDGVGEGNLPVVTTDLGLQEDKAYAGCFAVIVNDSLAGLKDGDQFYVTGVKSFTTATGSTGSSNLAIGTQSTPSGNTANWTTLGAVPEPTSGLLLLLGMAGLALRRRRA